MANEELRQRLRTLANRVAGRQVGAVEEIRLEVRVARDETATRQTVRKSIAETLDRSEAQVTEKLASHDDSDRLIDEIVNSLNSGKGK
jgi:hypothetical protein